MAKITIEIEDNLDGVRFSVRGDTRTTSEEATTAQIMGSVFAAILKADIFPEVLDFTAETIVKKGLIPNNGLDSADRAEARG